MYSKIPCKVCQELIEREWLQELIKDNSKREYGFVCSPACLEEAQKKEKK